MGCDQYVCPCPGQLINLSQLLRRKSSHPRIRSPAVYLLRSISSKDPHRTAFGCAEDQFRARHRRISNQRLPYSKTNKSMQRKFLYSTNLASSLVLIRKERSERASSDALVMHLMLCMASYQTSLLPCHSYCRPEVQRVT